MNAANSFWKIAAKSISIFFAIVFVGWVVIYFGLYLGYGIWKVRGHQDFAKNGVSQIQPAAEMNELFEDCRHYIVYTGEDSVSTWNTTAYFGGRYELTMQVPVEIHSADSGSTTGTPKFFLSEVESVNVSPSGQVGVSYSDSLQFGPNDWKKIYQSKGNFETVGFTLKKSPVPDFQKYAERCRPSN